MDFEKTYQPRKLKFSHKTTENQKIPLLSFPEKRQKIPLLSLPEKHQKIPLLSLPEKHQKVPLLSLPQKYQKVPLLYLPEKHQKVPLLTLPQTHKESPQLTLPQKQQHQLPKLNLPQKQQKVSQLNLPLKQKNDLKLTLPQKQQKVTQLTLLKEKQSVSQLTLSPKQQNVPKLNLPKKQQKAPQLNLPKKQQKAPQLTLPEKQQKASQLTLPEKQQKAPQLNLPQKQPKAPQLNLPENQQKALQLNLPQKQQKAPQLNLPQKQQKAPQLNLPEKQQKAPQLTLPEKQQKASQLTLPEKQQKAPQLNLLQKLQKVPLLTFPEKQQKVPQLTLPQKQQKVPQLTLLEDKQNVSQLTLLEDKQNLSQLTLLEEKQIFSQLTLLEEKQNVSQLTLLEEKQNVSQLTLPEKHQEAPQLSLAAKYEKAPLLTLVTKMNSSNKKTFIASSSNSQSESTEKILTISLDVSSCQEIVKNTNTTVGGDTIMNTNTTDGGDTIMNANTTDGDDTIMNANTTDGDDTIMNTNTTGGGDTIMNANTTDGDDTIMNNVISTTSQQKKRSSISPIRLPPVSRKKPIPPVSRKKPWVAVGNDKTCMVCSLTISKLGHINHLFGKKHKKNLKKVNPKDASTVNKRSLYLSDYPNNVPPEVIVLQFWRFGVRSFVDMKNFSYIEFDTTEGKEAAEKSEIFVQGRKIYIAQKLSTKNDNIIEMPPLSDSLEKLLSQPKAGSSMDCVIDQLVREVQLTPLDIRKRENVRLTVQGFLRRKYPFACVYVFGSSANNLGFVNCDVDLYVDLGCDNNPWSYGTAIEKERNASRLTWQLLGLIKSGRIAYNVVAIPKARVPLIKFVDSVYNIHIDLSFRHQMPVTNTALIRLYTVMHPLVRPTLMVIRYWAKVQSVAGGGKPAELITNYALTMMCLYVLMQEKPPIVPSVYELRRKNIAERGNVEIVADWDCSFSQNVGEYFHRRHKKSVMQLVKEFFVFYSSFEANKMVVCPFVGHLIMKDKLLNKDLSCLPTSYAFYCQYEATFNTSSCLCIQDPFDHSHNLTRGLKEKGFQNFRSKCTDAVEICNEILMGNASLDKLLEYYEVDTQLLETCEASTLIDNGLKSSQSSKILTIVDNLKEEIDLISNESKESVEILNESVKDNITLNDDHEIEIVQQIENCDVIDIDDDLIESEIQILQENAPNPNTFCHKFQVSLVNTPNFTIKSTGLENIDRAKVLPLDEVALRFCDLVKFSLEQCLKIKIKAEHYLTTRKRKFSGTDIQSNKHFKSDSGVIVSQDSYSPVKQYFCSSTHDLWVGRKKVAKQLVIASNVSPLEHEVAITNSMLKQISPNPEIFKFTLIVYQNDQNQSDVLVTAKELQKMKANKIAPMMSYLSSFIPNLFKKTVMYVKVLNKNRSKS